LWNVGFLYTHPHGGTQNSRAGFRAHTRSNSMKEKPEVFISHNADDVKYQLWIENLVRLLQQQGAKVHLDQFELQPGILISDFMEGNIRSSDYILVIVTEGYNAKTNDKQTGVGKETLIIAEEKQKYPEKTIIPLIMCDTNPDCIMPDYLSESTFYLKIKDVFHCHDEYKTLFKALDLPLPGSEKREKPIALAYALSWKCNCKCPICHDDKNGNDDEEQSLEQWKKHIKKFTKGQYNGSVRITLTGGDPMVYWQNDDESGALIRFIKYLHEQEIHICLNTTGMFLNKKKLLILNKYVDTILLSVRALDVEGIQWEFGLTEAAAEQLLNTQMAILENIKYTNIKLEISTVVTKTNIDTIEYLGWKLYAANPAIIWRIEEYYRNGKQTHKKDGVFDIETSEYELLMRRLYEIFVNKLMLMRHSSKESREKAPDLFLRPNGMLVTTCNNTYQDVATIGKYDFQKQPPKNRRSWLSYLNSLRQREWSRDNPGIYADEKNQNPNSYQTAHGDEDV
jgi:MoaA/NifB/PqqE/SkfB family radical SAM enzyme